MECKPCAHALFSQAMVNHAANMLIWSNTTRRVGSVLSAGCLSGVAWYASTSQQQQLRAPMAELEPGVKALPVLQKADMLHQPPQPICCLLLCLPCCPWNTAQSARTLHAHLACCLRVTLPLTTLMSYQHALLACQAQPDCFYIDVTAASHGVNALQILLQKQYPATATECAQTGTHSALIKLPA